MAFVVWQLRAEFPQSFDRPVKNQDPYVVFELGDKKVHTEVVKACGTFPDWVETYTLPEVSGAEQLTLSVYNKEAVLPDGLLGRTTLPVAALEGGAQQALPLVDSMERPAGMIFFKAARADPSKLGAQQMGGAGMMTGMGGAGMGMTGTGTMTGRGMTGTGTGMTGTGTGMGMGGSGFTPMAGQQGMQPGMMGAPQQHVLGGLHPGANTFVNESTPAYQTYGDVATGTTGYGTSGATRGISGMATGMGAGTGVQGGAAQVCDRQTFTTIEDRPVIKEQKTYIMEHHPYEKQYAVETKFVGETEVPSQQPLEHVGFEERVVEVAQGSAPCSDAPAIGQQAMQAGQQQQQPMQ